MSASEGAPADRALTPAVGDVPGRRLLIWVVGALFWGWLIVRWGYDRLYSAGVPVRHRTPFLPYEPIAEAAASIRSFGDGLGILGRPVGWLAYLVDLVAFAIESMPALADGAWITVELTVVAILLGGVIAVPLAVTRVYAGRGLGLLGLLYTELIRGTPLLAQLFVLWFGLNLGPGVAGLPGVGGALPSSAVIVAMIGFTINSSAYQAEYIRSALLSVDPGQLTAARAIGMTDVQGIRHVVLPQGLRFAIPGWTNEFIYLIKYSSLAAFIAVPELFRQARNIGSETFAFTEIYLVVAVFYLALVLTTAAFMARVEDRVAIPGLGQTARSR